MSATGLSTPIISDGGNMMVCYIERDVFATIDDDDIVYRFQSYRSRKGLLPRRSGTFLNMYKW